MCHLKVILSTEDVSYPSAQQIATIREFVGKYDLVQEAVIYETIHGHIARCCRKPGRYLEHEKFRPSRIDPDDIDFMLKHKREIRWIEVATDYIQIGL